jgi:ABC-type branched-subunit amino acid transport system ATPase component
VREGKASLINNILRLKTACKLVLCDVNLTAAQGKIVSANGLNGANKTTLLNTFFLGWQCIADAAEKKVYLGERTR